MHPLVRKVLRPPWRALKRVADARRMAYARRRLAAFAPPYRINAGCGAVHFDGWVNIDLRRDVLSIDLAWDLSQGIPVPDDCCEAIYSEHMLEHLSVPQGLAFLNECRRVLKPGGVLRIAMPSLDDLLVKCVRGDWREGEDWLTDPPHQFVQTRAEMVNVMFRWWGHQWLYDREELYRRLREAGFDVIRDAAWGRSEWPALRNRETRLNSRLICEAEKQEPCWTAGGGRIAWRWPKSPAPSPTSGPLLKPMTSPQVSVLMAVYNGERFLPQALDSVRCQTFTDFEFLIVDDGSTDDTRAILERYARRDGRIRFLSRSNTGRTRALNEALGMAQGEYVARMDADDVSLPDRFTRQVVYLREHPECDAVGTSLRYIDADGTALFEERRPVTHAEIDAELLAGRLVLLHPSLMARRSALLAANGYREAFDGAEDMDLCLRLAERGRLANLAEVLIEYRLHFQHESFRRFERARELARNVLADSYRRRGLSFSDDVLPPQAAPPTELEYQRYWAWRAFHAGHYATARKHAWGAVRQQFRSRESWILLAYALLGPWAEPVRRWYRRLVRPAS
ncbi:MAG TPA: glycosyltransferase [Pirellulales bacterium]|nr:glycosyltransferase [Pirellulales bacterium]